MDKMIVRVPVAVKAKVTEDLKLKIVGDLQNTIKNMELDLEQFEFQAKKALHQAASDLSVFRLCANKLTSKEIAYCCQTRSRG